MEHTHVLDQFSKTRMQVFQWIHSRPVAVKIALSLCVACLTGLLAQVRIPLPWTPVPLVGATFGVVLAGILLGGAWAGISMLIYLALGCLGMPWFTGGNSGAAILLGPTGGYLVGYAVAALLIGYISEKNLQTRKFAPMLGIMIFTHILVIHGLGIMQLGLWTKLVAHQSVNFSQLLWMGSLPFIPGDILKALFAAGIGTSIIPKESYIK